MGGDSRAERTRAAHATCEELTVLPALEEASTLAFDEIERAFLGAAEAKPKENAPGSYERLVKGFGQVNARAAMS